MINLDVFVFYIIKLDILDLLCLNMNLEIKTDQLSLVSNILWTKWLIGNNEIN